MSLNRPPDLHAALMCNARYLTILVWLVASPAPAAALPVLVAEPVTDQVWYFRGVAGQASAANQGFTSNAGFVVTADGVLVFDALGTPALAQAMLLAIASITNEPVRRVIVSHYHADHIYGLQVFKAAGAEIWARSEGHLYLDSDFARERLAERRRTLAPWVDTDTQLVRADRWLRLAAGQTQRSELGGTHFRLISAGHAHAPDDLMLLVQAAAPAPGRPGSSVLFAGDLYFSGRLPFVVDANTRGWLSAIDAIAALDVDCIVPGHGAMSCSTADDLQLTAEYLRFLREKMGAAVEQLTEFGEAYGAIDWSAYAGVPTFAEANRRNVYSVYLEMQTEMLDGTAAP